MAYIFTAKIATGIVPDPAAEGGKRQARWVVGASLPDDLVQGWLHRGPEDKKHPRNIPGMAWDLNVNAWRNMKNAQDVFTKEGLVSFSDSRIVKFIEV